MSVFFIGYSQSDFSRYGRDGLFPLYGWRMYSIFYSKQRDAVLRISYANSDEVQVSCVVPYCSIFNRETNIRLYYYMFKLSDTLNYDLDLSKKKTVFLENFFKNYSSKILAYEVVRGELDLRYFLTERKLVTEEKIIFKGGIQ
ncbi:MAG: hypothetical protein M9962_04390 [Oligoflexia bacterium]|nr:hypothetical protein [Oligoflexia bacterium]